MEKHKKSEHHKSEAKHHGKEAVHNPIASKAGHKEHHAAKKHKGKKD